MSLRSKITAIADAIRERSGTSNSLTLDDMPEAILNMPGSDPVPAYEGPYVVDANAHNDVVLETDGLRMTDDVTVHEIAYLSASNIAGGVTVTIGGE